MSDGTSAPFLLVVSCGIEPVFRTTMQVGGDQPTGARTRESQVKSTWRYSGLNQIYGFLNT